MDVVCGSLIGLLAVLGCAACEAYPTPLWSRLANGNYSAHLEVA